MKQNKPSKPNMFRIVCFSVAGVLLLVGIFLVGFDMYRSVKNERVATIKVVNDTNTSIVVETCGSSEDQPPLSPGKSGNFYVLQDSHYEACAIYDRHSRYQGCMPTFVSEHSNKLFYVSKIKTNIDEQDCGPEH